MTRQIVAQLPAETIEAQRSASDPTASVWVRANAGSGKTHVLTQRVLRLMLSGVPAASILCLTYTKAAAAEMRRRVGERLGRWAVLDGTNLEAELTAMEGAPPTPAMRLRARTLFAHALESPGGLKIQTIHAFCESVLHRFPVEADVPFDFTVIEDHERADMVLRAREQVLSQGLKGHPRVAEAVETLFEMLSDGQLTQAIDSALMEARKLRVVLKDVAGAKARLRRLAGHDPAQTRDEVLARAADETLFPPERWPELFAARPPVPGRTKNAGLCDKLYAARNRPELGATLFAAFLKDDGTSYADRRGKGFSGALKDEVMAEHDRLAGLYPLLRRAELIERSEALLDVLEAISERYEDEKRARALLDFDDLIEGAIALFEDETIGPWVRYKLDAGIDHILVDESQDTNFEQWRVVAALVDEYFAGEGAVERTRTVFAVGDEKQSIFSFQGAEPALFVGIGDRLARRADEARLSFRSIPLHTSFRSLPNVLNAVDAVFRREDLRTAALSEGVEHRTARAEQGGQVTLWAPVRDQTDEEPGEWPLEPSNTYQSAARQVAERIAREIAGWVRTGRQLGPRGRPVRFDDVLILVQARGALFRELIRAFHRQLVPTPGADRLEITGHIAVLDLMALGDVLLHPDDDLQLAALLRSPLFDLTEDELYEVAQPRGERETLWRALGQSTSLSAKSAYDELFRLRGRLDFERPFSLFAEVLYAGGGLKRFHRRFGLEVDDVFAEFLDLALEHERGGAPGLQAFLAAMRSREVDIRRDLGEGGSGVRVMTVHGAKGLEAPIVILADGATKPMGTQLRAPVYLVTEPPGPMLIHASARDDHTAQSDPYRQRYEERQKEEYWRKLYVAMTRAEDELYVTGTLTKRGNLEGTWFEAIQQGLETGADVERDEAGEILTLTYPSGIASGTAMGATPETVPPMNALVLPPVPAPPQRNIVRPSLAFAADTPEHVLDTAAAGVRDAEGARREGLALHALLQHLPKIPVADQESVATRALETLLPEWPERHQILAAKAMSILRKPEHAEIFGPQSRGEVPFLMDTVRDGKPVRLVGRMDRLVITDGTVLVVDFKSDQAPRLDPINPAYLTQVGLYALVAAQLFPDLGIEAAILWTDLESLIKLNRAALAEATRGFTVR